MRVCVYCGSNDGNSPAFRATAAAVGAQLAARGIGVVYGGGRSGCMGALADGALAAGGDVIGIIPTALHTREIAHPGLRDLRIVETMHERKALMTELSDAFLALPGGFGTLDELFEAITWRQLGYHHKPVAVLDVESYFAPLRAFCNSAQSAGFVRAADRASLRFHDDPTLAIDDLTSRMMPAHPRPNAND